LFAEAAKAVMNQYGTPDILIGHSLGGMANVMALNDNGAKPKLLISITPLIRLKENFESSMTATGVSAEPQAAYLKSFEEVGRQGSILIRCGKTVSTRAGARSFFSFMMKRI
jgi:pimeloyl-ACP methyl ester carboxylesterase